MQKNIEIHKPTHTQPVSQALQWYPLNVTASVRPKPHIIKSIIDGSCVSLWADCCKHIKQISLYLRWVEDGCHSLVHCLVVGRLWNTTHFKNLTIECSWCGKSNTQSAGTGTIGYSETLTTLTLLTCKCKYRVTMQVVPNLMLTWKWKLRFSICSLYRNATFVLMSTGGWELPEWSPCRSEICDK